MTNAIESAEDKRLKKLEITPIKYDYQRGITIFLSAKEKLVCDTYMRTRNLTECARLAMAHYGGKLSPKGIMKWLQIKPHMMAYLQKRMGELADWNMTKEEYFAKLRRIAEGVDKPDKEAKFYWKLLGQAKGWLDEGSAKVNNAIQINFTQSDGNS